MLNGKRVTNGVTNGVTGGHAYSDQLEKRLATAEKARLRKRRQRTKQKTEKIIGSQKTIYKVQLDGSCIWEWPHGTNIYFSTEQWTMFCKLRAIGVIPILTQVTEPGKSPRLKIETPPMPMDKPDERWLQACANDPNRDAIQIILK